MADQALIDEVKELLPADAAGQGWDDARIGNDLDAGKTKAAILAHYWDYRASYTATLVSVSESGSSRDLSTIHKNAVALAKYWHDMVAAETQAPVDELGVRRRVAFHRATRV